MKIGLLMPARERLNLNLTMISSIITTVDDDPKIKRVGTTRFHTAGKPLNQ